VQLRIFCSRFFVARKLRVLLGRVIAQAVSRRPLTAAAWVRVQVNPVGFVVEKVALGQVFLRVLRFSPVNIIPPWAPLFLKFNKIVHSFALSLILIRGRTIKAAAVQWDVSLTPITRIQITSVISYRLRVLYLELCSCSQSEDRKVK
jgi:hypothetical protein